MHVISFFLFFILGHHFTLRIYKEGEVKLDGNWYYNLVRYNCLNDVKALNPQQPNSLDGMFWQQDGATVHCTNRTMNLLDEQFGN